MEKHQHDEAIYRGLTMLQLKRLSIGVIFGLVGVFISMGSGFPQNGYNLFSNIIVLALTGAGYVLGAMIFKKQQ